MRIALTFPSSLEEEPYNEYLKARHTNHQCAFDEREIEDPALRALHSTHIPIFSSPEVFLVSVDGRKGVGDFIYGFFEGGGLLGGSALLGR